MANKETLEKDIGNILTSLDLSFSNELFAKTEEELEGHWYFKWDKTQDIVWNTYQFFDLLELYISFCRRWEEHHNGSCCVVERVRDKYTIPKIKLFWKSFLDLKA